MLRYPISIIVEQKGAAEVHKKKRGTTGRADWRVARFGPSNVRGGRYLPRGGQSQLYRNKTKKKTQAEPPPPPPHYPPQKIGRKEIRE